MENQEIDKLKYRFGGFKYSLRSSDTTGPDDIIPQESGLYTFPKGEEYDGDENVSSSSED